MGRSPLSKIEINMFGVLEPEVGKEVICSRLSSDDEGNSSSFGLIEALLYELRPDLLSPM